MQAIDKESKLCNAEIDPTGLVSLMDYLKSKFRNAILKAYPNLSEAPVVITVSTNSKFNDYQCNSAMPVSKMLKENGVNKNPRAVGIEIAEHITPCTVIDKVDVAGAGFINIFLNRYFFCSSIIFINNIIFLTFFVLANTQNKH